MAKQCGHSRAGARLAGCLLAAAVALGAASCPKEMTLTLDTKFSVNLARPAATWPRLAMMSAAELSAYEKYGKPDYFRILYPPRGEISTSREAGPTIRAKQIKNLPRSWIYEAKKIEIQFPSEARFVETPLSDQLEVLCLRGDPQERDVQTRNGRIREMWTYYDVGEKYFFLDGHLAEKQTFQAIGRPFSRL